MEGINIDVVHEAFRRPFSSPRDSFAVRLIKAMNRADMRVHVVAELTGIKSSSLSNLRTGRIADVHGATLVKLCRALNCSADYLLGLTEDIEARKA